MLLPRTIFSSTRSKRNRSRPLKDSTGRAPHCRRLAVWSGSAPERGPHRGLGAHCEREEDRGHARPTVAGTLPALTTVRLCAVMRGAARLRFLLCQFWPIAGAQAGLELELGHSSECRRLLGALCILSSTTNTCSRRRRSQRLTGLIRGQSSHRCAQATPPERRARKTPLRGRPAVILAGPVLGCSSSGEEAGRGISSQQRRCAPADKCGDVPFALIARP